MPESPAKKIFGLIGYPVKHSLSSFMHNAAFEALGINAEYKLFEVKPNELDNFLNNLDESGICGLNVTVPYKEKVLDFVKDADSVSKQIRAVNTLVKRADIWKGFNTDIPGFERHLKENIDPKNKKAAILGAGGAARAVSYVLANSKAQEIAIFDVDKAKSEGVVKIIKDLFSGFKINSVDDVERLDIPSKDLLVNATPVGLKEADPCLVKEEWLHKKLFVYDLIYNPVETKLLKLAKKVGIKNSNGLGMLLYQGMFSFEIWTGKKAPKKVMHRALLKALNTK